MKFSIKLINKMFLILLIRIHLIKFQRQIIKVAKAIAAESFMSDYCNGNVSFAAILNLILLLIYSISSCKV